MSETVMEFLAGFNGSPAGDWAVALCFLALPVGILLGWWWEARKEKKDLNNRWRYPSN